MMEAIMIRRTQRQLHADRIASGDIVRFQDLLNAETDDGKYEILQQLLADEFGKFGTPQQLHGISVPRTDGDIPKPAAVTNRHK
jgi:hypothetical protein